MYSNQGLVCHFLAWIVNALAKILNDKDNNVPRYILIILDKDLIQNAELTDFEFTRTLEDTLKWILININCMIETRKEDLDKKRPGALST